MYIHIVHVHMYNVLCNVIEVGHTHVHVHVECSLRASKQYSQLKVLFIIGHMPKVCVDLHVYMYMYIHL